MGAFQVEAGNGFGGFGGGDLGAGLLGFGEGFVKIAHGGDLVGLELLGAM